MALWGNRLLDWWRPTPRFLGICPDLTAARRGNGSAFRNNCGITEFFGRPTPLGLPRRPRKPALFSGKLSQAGWLRGITAGTIPKVFIDLLQSVKRRESSLP
jgi:hypothetical protein